MSWSVGGVDPGRNGGVVILASDGRIRVKAILPQSLPELVEFFREWAPDYVLIEKAQFMRPKSMGDRHHSPQPFFRYAKNAGSLEGALCALGISYGLIAPVSWQKEVGIGVSHRPSRWGKPSLMKYWGDDPKARALAAAKLFFPAETWFMSPKSRKPHDGVVDAALIAELARRRKLAGVLC
jgi:hypothetical protein